jgi:hypothetical protein
VRNSVDGCELCTGSGNYDPLPKLLELTDDKAAKAWIAEELRRSSGPCDHWPGFPEGGWYYDALGYNRVGKGGPARGVTLYNPDLMAGGVITWLEMNRRVPATCSIQPVLTRTSRAIVSRANPPRRNTVAKPVG